MAELDVSKTTTTDLTNAVDDFEVDAVHPDHALDQKETYHYFTDADDYTGYYKTVSDIKTPIDTLAVWVAGKGFTCSSNDKVILENIRGWGEDNITSIFQSLIVQKKVQGDAFAEIMRSENTGTLLNIKMLYAGDIRIVVDKYGIIKRYDQLEPSTRNVLKSIKPENMLHVSNQRYANEIHGTSLIQSCKWALDAKQEIVRDHRKVLHRNVVPVRIIEVDSDNTTKIAALKVQYQDAISKGEVLIVPKGVVEIKETSINIQDPTSFLQYLDDYIARSVQVPRIMTSSDGFTEAGGKVGFLTFDPVYTNEQTQLEADIWNQLATRIKFNRPPSLTGVVSDDEEKNSGQLGFQPNETTASAGRTE